MKKEKLSRFEWTRAKVCSVDWNFFFEGEIKSKRQTVLQSVANPIPVSGIVIRDEQQKWNMRRGIIRLNSLQTTLSNALLY